MTRRWIIPILSLVLGISLLSLGGHSLLPVFERQLIYFPTAADDGWPMPQLANGDLEEIELVTEDGVRVFVWHVTTRQPRIATILFFHGNGGNVFHRAEHIDGMAAQGLDVVLLEYRGYGKSTGIPSEDGLYRDAEAAYRYVTEDRGVDPHEIVLYGESLGSAVAVEIATRRVVSGLVVTSGFTSVREVGRLYYPFLPAAAFRLISHRYETLEKIGKLAIPVLVIHGTQDSIIPFSMGQTLFESLAGPRHWLPIEGADHNNVPEIGGSVYFNRLAEFAHEVTRS